MANRLPNLMSSCSSSTNLTADQSKQIALKHFMKCKFNGAKDNNMLCRQRSSDSRLSCREVMQTRRPNRTSSHCETSRRPTCNTRGCCNRLLVCPPGSLDNNTECVDMPAYVSASPFVQGKCLLPSYMTSRSASMMPQISRSPTNSFMSNKFSVSDWTANNKKQLINSMKDRADSYYHQARSWQTIKSTDHRTRNRQLANTKLLGERVQDISFWKTQLQQEIVEMQNELGYLYQAKCRVNEALLDSENPLRTARECQAQRERRQGIDLVHDGVDRKLSTEVQRIQSCQQKFKMLLEKAKSQIKLNRAAMHACESDAGFKVHAEGVDERTYQTRNSSLGIGYYHGIENYDNTISVPSTWVNHTKENLKHSQHARSASEKLRSEIDSALRWAANEMRAAFDATNGAFSFRITETMNASNQMQDQMAKTMDDISNMERNIQNLKQAILDKEKPLQVAMTRLEQRTRRMDMESCHDPAMTGLQQEIHELQCTLHKLRSRLHDSEQTLSRLMRTKSTLAHNIGIKSNTVFIDNKTCLRMRSTYPTNCTSGLFTSLPEI